MTGLVASGSEIRASLEEFVADVVMPIGRVERQRNAELYVRGMLGQGRRKSLEPVIARVADGDVAVYQSVQQFIADSPWDPTPVLARMAERVVPRIGVLAWIIDDSGWPKQGTESPGVARQYSGTLGKVGNCQIGVSVHAVGNHGTVPLGWSLYLPKTWCADTKAAKKRRKGAKIPEGVQFQTKPELALSLLQTTDGWRITRAPILGDVAYGKNTALRTALDIQGYEYVLSIDEAVGVFAPDTVFAVPAKQQSKGRPTSKLKANRPPMSTLEYARGLGNDDFSRVTYRARDSRGKRQVGRFAFQRVIVAHPVTDDGQEPREEWLIIEWPQGKDAPTELWLSNMPPDTSPRELARLAHLRWMIEIDYQQLKDHLGLDHYEGRSYAGWHHHTCLVTIAHAWLTEQRLNPKVQRPT